VISRKVKTPNVPGVMALVLVVALYVFQDYYRHHSCLEAVAKNELVKIVEYWEVGERDKAIQRLDHWNGNSKPWESYEEDRDPDSSSYPFY
jgi:hypothetical protein